MRLMPSSVSNVSRSSSLWKPNSARLSSRTWREVYSVTLSPTRPRSLTAVSGTLTRNVTPPTATSTQSAPAPRSSPDTDDISDVTTGLLPHLHRVEPRGLYVAYRHRQRVGAVGGFEGRGQVQ